MHIFVTYTLKVCSNLAATLVHNTMATETTAVDYTTVHCSIHKMSYAVVGCYW